MRKKIIKTFEQYAVDYELSKDVFNKKQLTENDIKNSNKRIYERLFVNYLLMKDVVDNVANESLIDNDDVIKSLNINDFDNDKKNFYVSFNKSKRLSFLTPYTIEELQSVKTYKLKNYNIGFAIKNGDIILVHNNEPNINGIGNLLINKAIEFDGDHLDHFDGFLTGFYKKNGFIFKTNEIFKEQYKPKNWEYKSVDIYNPDESIYVDELIVDPKDFMNAEKRYETGRPDVVYRTLK